MVPAELLTFDELLELWYLTQYNTWAVLSQAPTWKMLHPMQQDSLRTEFNEILAGYAQSIKEPDEDSSVREPESPQGIDAERDTGEQL